MSNSVKDVQTRVWSWIKSYIRRAWKDGLEAIEVSLAPWIPFALESSELDVKASVDPRRDIVCNSCRDSQVLSRIDEIAVMTGCS